MFLTVSVARHLGSSELGVLAYSNSILTIGLVVLDSGLTSYLIREISSNRNLAHRLESIIFTLRLIITIIFTTLMVIYLKTSNQTPEVQTLVMLAYISIPLSIIPSVVSAVLRANQNMWFEALFRFFSAVLNTVVGLLLIFQGFGVIGLIFLAIALNLLSLIYFVLVGIRQKVLNISLYLNWKELAYVIREAFPFASVAILVVIYFRIDSVMIQQILGPDAGGRYAAVYKIMEFLFLVPTTISMALFPALSKALYQQPELVSRSLKRAVKWVSMVTFPIVVGGIVLASDGIRFLYTEEYLSSTNTLQVLLLILIPVTVSFATSTVISVSKTPIVNAYIALAMVIFNILGNLLLIPYLGILGAAISTVLTEVIALILGTVYIWKRIFSVNFLSGIIRPAFAALLMGLVVLLYPSLFLIPVYAIVFSILLVLLKAFDSEDRILLAKFIPKSILEKVTLVDGVVG